MRSEFTTDRRLVVGAGKSGQAEFSEFSEFGKFSLTNKFSRRDFVAKGAYSSDLRLYDNRRCADAVEVRFQYERD